MVHGIQIMQPYDTQTNITNRNDWRLHSDPQMEVLIPFQLLKGRQSSFKQLTNIQVPINTYNTLIDKFQQINKK